MTDLKDWREGQGLDQQGAAARVGVTRAAWASYEAGRRRTPPGVLAILAATGADIEPEALPTFEAPAVKATRARSGDVAAPVKIVGQDHRGLNIGADGRLYGQFTKVSEQPKLAKLLAGTGARWSEYFPSANGFGTGSTILWGILKGEGEGDCAPVSAGRHYAPWRASVGRSGSGPAPKGERQGKRAA